MLKNRRRNVVQATASHSSIIRANYSFIRLVAVFLIIALLMPTIYWGDWRKVSAGSANPPIAQTAAPVAAPPEHFVFSSSNQVSNAALSSVVTLSQSLANSYRLISDSIISPELPEGFAAAKIPTLWETASNSISSIPSFISSYISPLFSAPSALTTTAPATPPAPFPPGTARFDFDGDGKADASRWQSSTGAWRVKQSSNAAVSTLTLGTAAAIIAPADYDGDGKTDRACFDSSTGIWTIYKSASNQTQTVTGFGQWGDKAVAGDYDGDGAAEPAVWRPSNGTFYVKQLSGGTVTSVAFGAPGDVPVAGNYDGDLKMDYAVFRPSTGVWHLLFSSSNYGYAYFQWGLGSDTPVPADYDGDGKTDLAVYRPSNGTWYASMSSSTAAAYLAKAWGNYGDQPAPADYDGDGKADFALWRPTTGTWYIVKSSDASFNTYAYEQLGQAGDIAAPSAYIKQIGGQVNPYAMAKARLAPKNATGGTDLYSRNFSWGAGLAGLPGRAGLDAGFGIAYNSLVWTKQSGVMSFDVDNSNVSPGFRFGFPTIEPSYLDPQTGRFAYLMVTPSGRRVEFRQEAASNIYETADSSYTRLTFSSRLLGAGGQPPPVEDGALTATGTDGAQMTFVWLAGAYRCSQIKDRNGNFITITHDQYGLLQSVKDTLGRLITVEYDSQQYPTVIRQTRKATNGAGSDVTHNYAAFTYTNTGINTNFADPATSNAIPVFGPPNGTNLKVLQKITFAGGGSTTFEYNGYGQVSKINNYASDNHLLNSARTDLQSAGSAAQSDCPRFSETRTFVENFNLDQNGQAQETVVHNSFAESQSYSVGGLSGTATRVEVTMDDAPHSVMSRTWYYPGGNWAEGLAFATEDFGDNARKRWTTTAWTQDNPSLAYLLNPRVAETKVGDDANIKKTVIDYHLQTGSTTASLYGLVSEVKLYDGSLNSLLKRATTDYNLGTTYTSRRIIGLPSESKLYDGNDSLMSKVTYAYDEGDFSDTALAQNVSSAVQHDNTNYGASFVTGRGNLTTTTRHDVLNASTVASHVKYNTAGAAVLQIDPLGREVEISYADKFNDDLNNNLNRSTYAYPTVLTTPGSVPNTKVSSFVNYRYDTGANVRAKSPAPAGNSSGKETAREFDSTGRLVKETLVNTGAYTRYDYSQSDRDVHSRVYSTVIDRNGDGADATDEVLSEAFTDGAGRVRQSRTDNPNSTGLYSGQLVEYDILGQVKRQSVATEIDSNWNPAGDDAARGWLWTHQKYDWKGRVVRKINTDGIDSTTLNASDVLMSYEGCGCAGGEVTTIQGESVPVPNQANAYARRTQKIYANVQGRTEKTEVMNWNGTTPYTTTVNTFNGRDQITNTRQYAGAVGSGTYQDVTMTYDGHGRLETRKYPIEDPGTRTTWVYNQDDSIYQVIDPRGVITGYTYGDPRGLLTNISYTLPLDNPALPSPKHILPTPNVTYLYDDVGNRRQMSEGTTGTETTNYSYDSLSRLTSETKHFSDLTPNYTIGYTYNLGGGLKSITDPFGSTVNYTHDKTGRLTKVTGTAFGDNTTGNYVDGIQYRAFGGIKQMTYKTDDNALVSMQYDNRLRVSQHQVASSVAANGYLKKAAFSYYADSSPQWMDNQVNDHFDRAFAFDHAGRLIANQFGNLQAASYPYQQTIAYDAFSQMTSRWTTHWGTTNNFSASFVNGRKQTVAYQVPTYDAAGNLVDSGVGGGVGNYQRIAYDAANRPLNSATRYRDLITLTSYATYENETQQAYDGDGHPVKITQVLRRISPAPQAEVVDSVKYQIWSTVLGNTLTSLRENGTQEKTKVFAGGAVVATQYTNSPNDQLVIWTHADPLTGSSEEVGKSGASHRREELEPLGQEVEPDEPPMTGIGIVPSEPGFSSSEPEWLCKYVSDEDWQMPASCQRAVNESLEYEIIRSPSNPTRVAAPPVLKQRSREERERAKALAATQKPSPTDNEAEDEEGSFDESEPDDFLDASKSMEQQTKVIPARFNNLVYFSDEGDLTKRIADIVDYATKSKECTKAFEAVNAKPIIEQLKNVTVVTQNVFDNPQNDSLWTNGSDAGDIVRGISKKNTSAFEIAFKLDKFPGYHFIALTNAGLTPTDLQRKEFLSVILIHSLIHSGGVPGQQSEPESYGLTTVTPHDLKYLGKQYYDILKHCTKEGHSNLLYGG